MPKRSRGRRLVSEPVRVVAPTRVKRGKSRRMERAAMPHHDVEGEVLERRVQHLFDHAVQAMDLVDEQDIALLEVREDGRQIALCARWPGLLVVLMFAPSSLATTVASVVFLPRPRTGPREQDMIHHVAARLSRLAEDGERLLDLRLPQVVAQALRAQTAIEREIVLGERRRHRARACVDGRRAAIPPRSGARFEHEPASIPMPLSAITAFSSFAPVSSIVPLARPDNVSEAFRGARD